jgi:hypothetical protein
LKHSQAEQDFFIFYRIEKKFSFFFESQSSYTRSMMRALAEEIF